MNTRLLLHFSSFLCILQNKDASATKSKSDDYDIMVRELIFEAKGKVRLFKTLRITLIPLLLIFSVTALCLFSINSMSRAKGLGSPSNHPTSDRNFPYLKHVSGPVFQATEASNLPKLGHSRTVTSYR